MLWQIQDRYTCKECSQLYFDDEQSNFNTSKQALSSILQLSRYLENKTLLVDPRFISLIQDVQTHFIGDKQLRIGEENLNDILESNSVVMAFFDRDGLDILNLLKSHNLLWKKFTDQSFEIIIDGISHRLIPFSLSKSEDYIEFILRKVKRIIPKFAVVKYRMENESFVGPADWIRFVWTLQRSRFISCEKDFAARYRQTYPQFFSGKPRIQNGIILTLQRFRNWAIERGMTPMLHAGTLLGWYRECGIITYTHDIDFTVFIEEHYDKFPDDVMNSSFIELSLRFNKPEDLLEYKVYIENGIPMDIFFLYHDQNSSWIGGLSGATKFIYPLINRTCATDLLGYLMYVPCNALDVIATEYGNWSEPLHSSKYSWNSSPRNKKLVGKVPPEERAESFIQYNSVKNKKANEKKSNPPIKRVSSQRAEHYKTSNVSQRLMNT
uniref:Bm8862 n=1 Tax=Brugia malayi TaxID=6279 RepID=A0A0J9XN43_BRUMA|nr:Bm8862 [Brugia malayi]